MHVNEKPPKRRAKHSMYGLDCYEGVLAKTNRANAPIPTLPKARPMNGRPERSACSAIDEELQSIELDIIELTSNMKKKEAATNRLRAELRKSKAAYKALSGRLELATKIKQNLLSLLEQQRTGEATEDYPIPNERIVIRKATAIQECLQRPTPRTLRKITDNLYKAMVAQLGEGAACDDRQSADQDDDDGGD